MGQMLRTRQYAGTFCFLLLVGPGSAFAGEQPDWGNLREVRKGEKISVVLNSSRTEKGVFESFNADAVVLTRDGSSFAIDRKDVVRVTVTGRNKRLRNMAIGMAIGAGAGALIGALSTGEDTWFRSAWIGTATVGGLGIGAGVGAAIPGHPVVYRVK